VTKHFISLSDVPFIPAAQAKLLGQYVTSDQITWSHTCTPEHCDDYNAAEDPYIYGVPQSRTGHIDSDGDYVFSGDEVDPLGRSVLD
jgi:hypothetical protein